MLKKLTAKVQQLNPNLPDTVGGFAKCISIEPETQELLLKKGSVYVVFEIAGNTQFEISLISNVVHDMLHDSYYESDNISPIQSLEKAITEVREKVTQLTNESIIIDKPQVEFRILAAVLWGNVLYVVQFGDAKSYLMRTGEVRPINTMSEGSFSAASGVVKSDDVIILCSGTFAKTYPPDKLLSMAIPENSLAAEEACLLMKFSIDTTFTPNEVVDFGLNRPLLKKSPAKRLTPLVTTTVQKLQQLKQTVSSFVADRILKPITSRPAKTQSASKDAITVASNRTGIKLRYPTGFKLKPLYLVPLLIIALAISITITLRKNKTNKPAAPDSANQQQTAQPTQEVKPATTTAADIPTDTTLFYELKLADEQIAPTGIAVFTNNVVVTDKTSGKIYVSLRKTAKFVAETKQYIGIDNVINIKGNLGFVDSEGYKVYDMAKSAQTENYPSTELGVTSAYSDFVYSIKDGVLYRYAKSGTTLTGSVWGQNEDFKEVKSFGISYSIFALKTSGEVVKYTTGTKDSFTLTGGSKKLTNPSMLVADVDFDNIYIADTGNQRVVAYDKKGTFLKEYTASRQGAWENIKAIAVSPDEKTVYVLAGTRVYEVLL